MAGSPATCTYTGRDTTLNDHKFTGVAGCTGAVADGATVRKDITENGSGTGINHAGLDLEYHANVNVHGDSHVTATGNVTLASTIDVTATGNAAAGPDKGVWASGTGYTKGDVVKGSDGKRYAATKDIVASSGDDVDPVSHHGLLDPWTEAKSKNASVAATFVLALSRSQLSGTSWISTSAGDVSISSNVKTKVTTNADSSAAGLGAGIAVAVFVTDSQAYIDSTAATPVTAKNLTLAADTDNAAPTKGTASPKGDESEGGDTSANSPTANDTGGVSAKQTAAAGGKADGKSTTADGGQNKSAALAVVVLIATTQAYISPADASSAHIIDTTGGVQTVHAGAKNVASATADAGNVKFSPDPPTLTASTSGGSLGRRDLLLQGHRDLRQRREPAERRDQGRRHRRWEPARSP